MTASAIMLQNVQAVFAAKSPTDHRQDRAEGEGLVSVNLYQVAGGLIIVFFAVTLVSTAVTNWIVDVTTCMQNMQKTDGSGSNFECFNPANMAFNKAGRDVEKRGKKATDVSNPGKFGGADRGLFGGGNP